MAGRRDRPHLHLRLRSLATNFTFDEIASAYESWLGGSVVFVQLAPPEELHRRVASESRLCAREDHGRRDARSGLARPRSALRGLVTGKEQHDSPMPPRRQRRMPAHPDHRAHGRARGRAMKSAPFEPAASMRLLGQRNEQTDLGGQYVSSAGPIRPSRGTVPQLRDVARKDAVGHRGRSSGRAATRGHVRLSCPRETDRRMARAGDRRST